MRIAVLLLISFFSISFVDLNSAMKDAGYRSIELEKNLFGEYILDAKVNGKNFEMMLSLNIEQTFIDKILADKYGFEIEQIEGRDLKLNGDEGEMYAVKIDEFSLGVKKSNENEIGAIDFSNFSYLKQLRVEGILGKSFLTKHQAVLDIAGEKLFIIQ